MSTIEEVSNTKRKISFEIPAEEAKPHFEAAIEYCSQKIKLKGFRPGKIPRSVVIKQCMTQIRKYLLENFVSTKVYDGLKEHDLNPLSVPYIETLEIAEDQPLKCTAVFDLYPTFEMPSLDDIELTMYNVYVSDPDINEVLTELQYKQATVRTLEEDRGIVYNDLADISYEIFHNGKKVPLKKDDPTSFSLTVGTVGNDPYKFYPEVEAGIMGMKIGEVKDVPVKMPADTPFKNLAGKKVIFRITVQKIRVQDIPEINDELAEDAGFPGVTDLKSLKESIVKEITASRENDNIIRMHRELLYKISQKTEIEVPESLLKAEFDLAVENHKKNMALRYSKNVDPNSFVTPDVLTSLSIQTEVNLRNSIILNKVKSENSFTATEEEFEHEILDMAYVTGQSIEALKKFYAEPGENNQGIKSKIENRKALDFLCSKTKIIQADPPSLFDPDNPGDLAQRLVADLERETQETESPQPAAD